MPILKFIWLAIRPVSKLESAVGWWDAMNVFIWAGYITTPHFLPLSEYLKEAPLIWFASIPALLMLIAGLKLQFLLSKIENSYEFALSTEIDESSVFSKVDYCEVSIIFTNTLDKALNYQIDLEKTFVQIGKTQPLYLKSKVAGGIISKGKSERRLFREIKNPEILPCKGIIHCEVLYGAPHGKKMFPQLREWEIEIAKGPKPREIDITFITKNQEG